MALTDSSLRKGRAVFIALAVWVVLLLVGMLCMSVAGELKARWTSGAARACMFLLLVQSTWAGSVWGCRLLLAWMGFMLAVSGYMTAMGTISMGVLFGTPVGLSLLGSFVVSATFMGFMLLYEPLREFIGHQQELRLKGEAES